jgi:methyl-accepting chemotaxis protein
VAAKITISSKWKLTISLLIMLIPVIGGMFAVQSVLISRIDDELFQALQERLASDAVNMGREIRFEMIANLRDDLTAKLRDLARDRARTASLIVLDAKKNVYVSVGETVDVKHLLSHLPAGNKATAVKIANEVVGLAPIINDDENQVIGYLLYTESKRDYYEFRTRMNFWQLLVVSIGITFILLGVYTLVSRSTEPIFRLAAAAQRIAEGDLSKVEVDVKRSVITELEKLSVAVNSMAMALQSQVTGIKGLTNNMSGIFKDIIGAVTSFATSASQQASAVNETAATVEEIEQTSKTASGNAGRIVEVAKKTQEASLRGRDAIKVTNDIVAKIRDDSKNVSSKSAKLLAEIEEVESVIGSVKAIAEQSKILAVNASIEAAKAGEYGSGFAVVAQEVKELAQQSKDATLRITSTLGTIRTAIEDVVETSENGQKRTEEGVNMISNVGAIMYDLGEAIRENSEFANVIATSIKQQTVGLSQISSAMEEINTSATENRSISQTIEMRANQMNKEVEELTALVDRWRIRD